MKTYVLFIHGAGEGAYEEDRPLARSLQNALGSAYEVRYPRMRNEDSPEYADWKQQIASELADLDADVIAVGHSVGGSILIKYLSEEELQKPVAGLFLLAAPFWDGDGIWNWDEIRLPDDLGERLSSIRRIVLYHSRDDEIVPFEHLSRYGAILPQAARKELDGGGHQFGNDLAGVAEEIRRGQAQSE